MNNKIPLIIFSYFDSKLIHEANDYIQNTYNTKGILYCTPQFAAEIINSTFINSFVSPRQEQIQEQEQEQEQERGWIGQYEGIQVVSIPELYGGAILLPKIKTGDINNE